MAGASVSLTVTVNEQVLVLPDGSVAVQVTVFVPRANVEPDGGTQDTVALPELSLAVVVNVTLLREHCPASVASTRLLEQVIDGGCVSASVYSANTTEVEFVPLVAVAVIRFVVRKVEGVWKKRETWPAPSDRKASDELNVPLVDIAIWPEPVVTAKFTGALVSGTPLVLAIKTTSGCDTKVLMVSLWLLPLTMLNTGNTPLK
jgi:hypothetical protein